MNRFRVWGIVVVLTVSATVSAIAADLPVDTTFSTDNRPWYKKMFFSTPSPVGPTVRSGPVTGMVRPPSALLSPEVVADARKAEEAAWNRRMLVCNKLREAADARGDDALMRQVDELERQANAIYQQRVAALGVPKVKAPLPPAANTGFPASFDLMPEKTIDPKVAASLLVAPAAPVPVGTAEVREVKP